MLTAERDHKRAKKKSKSGRLDVTDRSARGTGHVSLILIGSILLVVFVLPVWPAKFTKPWLTNAQVQTLGVYSEGWFDAMNWLRDNTPIPVQDQSGDGPCSRCPLVDQKSEYGVFSSWDFGNVVAAIGGRVPLYSRYPTPPEGRFLMARSEKRAKARLCRSCKGSEEVRYVIVDARTAGDFFVAKGRYSGRPVPVIQEGVLGVDSSGKEVHHSTFGVAFDSSMTARLYLDDGRNLRHYRLVYEPPEQAFVAYKSERIRTSQGLRISVSRVAKILDDRVGPVWRRAAKLPFMRTGPTSYVYEGRIQSSLKIFEWVRGAKLTGRLPSSGSVYVSLPLSITTTGRALDYESTVITDSTGFFKMVLPYATQTADSAVVQVAGEYSFRFKSKADVGRDFSWTMTVTEEDVLDGNKYRTVVRRGAVKVRRHPHRVRPAVESPIPKSVQ